MPPMRSAWPAKRPHAAMLRGMRSSSWIALRAGAARSAAARLGRVGEGRRGALGGIPHLRGIPERGACAVRRGERSARYGLRRAGAFAPVGRLSLGVVGRRDTAPLPDGDAYGGIRPHGGSVGAISGHFPQRRGLGPDPGGHALRGQRRGRGARAEDLFPGFRTAAASAGQYALAGDARFDRGLYKVPGNREAAERYGIVVGTSHCEPMMRNNVGEWDEARYGAYNFVTNRAGVLRYWREQVLEVAADENIFTLGMAASTTVRWPGP